MLKLYDLGILGSGLAEKGVSMIKMRNIIVHQYGNIDYELLFEGLNELSKEFIQIQKEIMHWIETKE